MSIKLAQRHSQRWLRSLRYLHALFSGVLIASLLFVLLNAYVVTIFRVDGRSMQPSLRNGQLVPVYLLAYLQHAPERGDVVIVQYAGDTRVRFVKRIVGVPGDVVQEQSKTITLGEDQYYVVGDNRDHSTDSRVFGPVSRTQILGQALNVPPYETVLSE